MITFKPDVQTSEIKVVDIITELQHTTVKFLLPILSDPNEVKELDLRLIELDELENTDLGILAVNHKFFRK